MLVDFISIKLAKQERGLSWNTLGYDMSNFTVPKRGQMKSNFLKPPAPEPKVEPKKEEKLA